jgi:hypothetical protein
MNITKITESFIDEHPSIKDCMKMNLLNYSKLSRMIAEKYNIDQLDAILIACRRYFQKTKRNEIIENKITDILRKSKIIVKTKIIVAIIEQPFYFDSFIELQRKIKKKGEIFHVIQGSDTITIMTTYEFKEDIEEIFKNKLLEISEDLAEVVIQSEESLELTPGWISYLSTLLAENNINIIETMSAWNDTVFVINKSDISKTLELFKA